MKKISLALIAIAASFVFIVTSCNNNVPPTDRSAGGKAPQMTIAQAQAPVPF